MTAAPLGGDQPSTTTPVITGQTTVPPSPVELPNGETAKVAFEDAWQELSHYESGGLVNLSGFSIHMIHGSGVTIDGRAGTWIVGVQQGGTGSILLYNQQSWKQEMWGEAFSQDEIDLKRILQPTRIYEINRETIEKVMTENGAEMSDMDLSDGIYTVYIQSSSGLSTITFNASTGELLSQIV
jgi:hypothetical protein